MNKKSLKAIKWTARILALAILIFLVPFYFGYGNPLPFAADYTFIENLWLTIVPIMMISLAIGWKWPKPAGYIITISIVIGLIAALILEKEFLWPTLVPLAVGVLYLITAYKNPNH